MTPPETFDFIVVGAGSAGCVLANRLSARPQVRVLLLEAGGPDSRPEIHDPARLLELWGSDVDWNYTTEPQAQLADRQIMISRGKVLGGSSALYAMIYVRGNRRDYDRWAALGNDGWAFSDVLPYFRRSEDNEHGASPFHGVGGPLAVRDNPAPTPVADAFTNAAVEMGYEGPAWDFNGPRQEDGAGLYQVNITRAGKRCSTATAFLAPIRDRSNLVIRTGAHVTRILLEGKRATGVEYLTDGALSRVECERDVVVAAGAFDSPKLLMLSGIGPADSLSRLGVPVAADLPGVGAHLQDHLLVPVFYTSRRPLPPPLFIAEAGLFVRTPAAGADRSPDLQFHFSAGIPAFVPRDYPIAGPNFAFVPILVQPDSEGTVSLRSANPLAPPVIEPNYLQASADLEVLCRGVRLARHLVRTSAFDEFRGEEAAPGEHASDSDVRRYVRTHCSTVWHVSGTCRMGVGRDAVVDPRLRVHGIDGLRVADASIMPKIVSGNTNAACVMIGEKAADLILGAPAEAGVLVGAAHGQQKEKP